MVKKCNAIQAFDTSNLIKKLTATQKLMKLKRNHDHDHNNNYVTTQKFNKLTSEGFAARLKQANLASKNDIGDYVKKSRF